MNDNYWITKAALLRMLDHVPDDAFIFSPKILKFLIQHKGYEEWGDLNLQHGLAMFHGPVNERLEGALGLSRCQSPCTPGDNPPTADDSCH